MSSSLELGSDCFQILLHSTVAYSLSLISVRKPAKARKLRADARDVALRRHTRYSGRKDGCENATAVVSRQRKSLWIPREDHGNSQRQRNLESRKKVMSDAEQ